MRKTVLGFIAALLLAFLATPASAQWTQKELQLTTDPLQHVWLDFSTILQPPAVQVGNLIYLGFIEGSPGFQVCFVFYVLQPEDEVTKAAQENFLGIVIGQGNTRRYLYGHEVNATECTNPQAEPGSKGRP